MLIQLLDERIRLRPVHAHNVMQVRPNVQIHPARGFVDLSDAVPCHGGGGGLDVEVGEEGWRAYLAGVVEAVGAYEGHFLFPLGLRRRLLLRLLKLVMRAAGGAGEAGRGQNRNKKLLLGGVVEVVPCGAGVCEIGVAALASGWDCYGAEGRVGGAAGVEAAVYVLMGERGCGLECGRNEKRRKRKRKRKRKRRKKKGGGEDDQGSFELDILI